MSYRAAAEAAYLLACDEDAELAKLGVRLLSDLADKSCYLAMLCMVYLHDTGGHDERDIALARLWAARAKALHPMLTDADDLCDAGNVCSTYAYWFETTEHDALSFWQRAASLGSGFALWQICETNRVDKGSPDWVEKLALAAALGNTEAMVEFSEQDGVQGTEQELIWLRAAAALGNLRAKEILEY
ncbi:hypothetical protein [Massilia niabensis]|uniref:Sel1 repeat family protein n=1 Tax=Massilia niabensis TaxID=544910 RepID=A0ABW0LB57_9BURK